MTGPNGRRRLRQLGHQPSEGTATVEEVSRILGQPLPPRAAPARPTHSRFSLTETAPWVRSMAVLFGVFLCYAVFRIQELYPALNVRNLPLMMAIAVALGVVASMPVAGWRTIWDTAPSMRWQALLVVLAVVTAPVGIWMSGSLWSFTFIYSISVIVFLATVVFLRDRRAMTTVFRMLLLIITILALYTLGDEARTMGKSDRVKLGVSLDPNDLAMLFVVMAPLALYMSRRKGVRSGWWTLVAVLCVVAVIPTQSRGAILGLGAATIALVALGTSGWKRTFYLALAIAGAFGLFALASAMGADRLSDFSDYSGGESRTAIWKRGLVWMSWRPWGYGLDNFPIFFGWMNGRDRAAHNSFIEVGVELGVLGLLAFVMLWLHTARDLLRQRRHALSLRATPGADREAALATFVLAAMAGAAGCGFFLSKAYAGITLFTQGLGIAVLLGYPFRDAAGQAAPPPQPTGPARRGGAAMRAPPAARGRLR